MPTQEKAHLCLIRDVGIFWLLAWGHGHFHQPGDSSPLCLLPAYSGTWASSCSLGTGTPSASSACLGTWASPGSLGQDHFCQHRDMRIFWLLRNRILSACLGTWPLSTAWGQECSLLTASLLRNMAIFWIPGDQITFPGVGTGSLRPTWGQEHFCWLGEMGISLVTGSCSAFWGTWESSGSLGTGWSLPAQEHRHFSLLEDRSPLYLGHLQPPWEQDHICLLGDKTTACLGTWASPGSLGTGGLTKPLLWHPVG